MLISFVIARIMIQKDNKSFDYIKHEIPSFAPLNSFGKIIWLMV